MTDEIQCVLTTDEQSRILMALARGQGGPFVLGSAEAAMVWALEARLQSILLELVLGGQALLRVDQDGELRFLSAQSPLEVRG